MDPTHPRLMASAYAGDVVTLRQLLREDRLLLHRHTTMCVLPADGPLHVAAALGHSGFVKEILAARHELARNLNGEGLTALHLASSHGHPSVVKELLQSTSGSQLCLVRGKDGFMPVHAAAINGRVDVIRELIDASPESLRARTTTHGYSVLHLAVISNYFECVEFLVAKINEDDDLLNTKDDKGNTALHLAVARKQLQTVKLLLGRRGIKVNDVNSRCATALDVLLESPVELHGDLLLGETIRAAGGTTDAEIGHQKARRRGETTNAAGAAIANIDNSTRSANRLSAIRGLRGKPSGHAKGDRSDEKHKNRPPSTIMKPLGHAKGDRSDEKYKNRPSTIMVVATLIATITFQSGLNPPGVLSQQDGGTAPCGSRVFASAPNDDSFISNGEAVLDPCRGAFLLFDAAGLFASLSIILLLLCCVPLGKRVMKILVCIAVFSTAMAFLSAFRQIFCLHSNDVNGALLWRWYVVLALFMLWLYIRVTLCLLRKVGWCKKKKITGNDGESHAMQATGGAALIVPRILVLVLLIVLLGIFAFAGYVCLILMLRSGTKIDILGAYKLITKNF